MPTADERLLGIRAKIERAKRHIGDLEANILAFRKTDPYRILSEYDAQAGQRVFRVHVHAYPPVVLSLLIGEAVHQLRSCLDHLAWQLVDTNGQPGGTNTYFPICQSAAKYKTDSPRKVKGMSPGAIGVIDALEPYQGGNDNLWSLHELNNIDKHRLLPVVAFGVYSFGLSLRPTQEAMRKLAAQGVRAIPGFVITRHTSTSGLARVFDDGAELGRMPWLPIKADEELNLAFEIAFAQPQIVHGKPVVPFLHQLSSLVDGVVSQFVPFL